MPYVELHACSAFSFLRGGSFPEHLAETAAGLGMPIGSIGPTRMRCLAQLRTLVADSGYPFAEAY